MKYISALELSKRWNVSPRYIQKLCKSGRLLGAERFGKAWMIPEDVERPMDQRQKNTVQRKSSKQADEECYYSVMAASYQTPGSADEVIKGLAKNPEGAALTSAQFAYLRGNIEEADSTVKRLFDSSDNFEIKIGAAFLKGICAMYHGNVTAWQQTKTDIKELSCPDESYLPRKEMWLAAYGSAIYDLSGYPEWYRKGCFDCLPVGYYSAARVHYIKYLCIYSASLINQLPIDYQEMKGQLFLIPAICEPLISQTMAEKSIVAEIYLRLLCASGYHFAGNEQAAIEQIDRALALGLPDQLYAPFAEQRLNLDTLLDERMKLADAKTWHKMKTLNEQLMIGWSALHNTVMHCSHSNALSAKEMEAAKLAVFGLTNKEIAVRMGSSVNSVKGLLQSSMDKLDVKKRAELAKYL